MEKILRIPFAEIDTYSIPMCFLELSFDNLTLNTMDTCRRLNRTGLNQIIGSF